MDNFFAQQAVAGKLTEHKTLLETAFSVTLAAALVKLRGAEYKVVAHFVNCVQFGYYKQGSFYFADGCELKEKYLEQLRIFNLEEELYLQRQGEAWCLQYINDTQGTDSVQAVDSSSQFFGHSVEGSFTNGFIKLWEAGRKISLLLPAKQKAERYELVTRSYVQYDAKTGQAGYSTYRWVDIAAVKEGEE